MTSYVGPVYGYFRDLTLVSVNLSLETHRFTGLTPDLQPCVKTCKETETPKRRGTSHRSGMLSVSTPEHITSQDPYSKRTQFSIMIKSLCFCQQPLCNGSTGGG